MPKSKKILYSFLLLLLLIQYSYTELIPSDLLHGPIELHSSAIYHYGYGKLIPFANNVFGTSYVGTDINVYAIFMKNGNKLYFSLFKYIPISILRSNNNRKPSSRTKYKP